MSTNTRNQSGFGMVAGVIAAIVIIAVIGFIGWRIYNQPNKQANDTTSSSQYTNKTPVSNNTPSATPQPTYLDIKELGVKMQLDDSVKDAVYSYHTASDGSQYVYLSTQSLINASNGTCNDTNGGLVSITKATGSPQQLFAGRPFKVDNTTMFQYGSDTYVYIGGRQATCSTSAAVENLASQQEAAFFKDFKTLQLDQ